MDNIVINNSNATTVTNDGDAMSTETKERNHMQRLIDAEKLGLTDFEIVMCDGDYKEALKMLIEKIENAPTVDAEPVVRCKDCVYYNAMEGFCKYLSNNYAPAVEMEENDFCSKGKRREDA